MTITWSSVGWALVWCAVAGLAAWLLLWPVRRRSFTGLLTSLVLTGAAASAGAVWGGVHSMLLPQFSWQTMLLLTLATAVITTLAAVATSRRLGADAAALRDAVAEVGRGRMPGDDGRRLTAEVEQVRRQLLDTAAVLDRTRQRERALESSRRELVSWVSHDLRTPLAGLRAMAEALEDGVAENPEQYYKQIAAAVETLNRMVEDLFDLSRLQAGTSVRDHGPVRVDLLACDVADALGPLAAAREVTIATSGTADSPVAGDAQELRRAVTNLLGNAIRHTRAGGRVRLTLDATDAAISLGIADQCGGIPAEHLARVFDVGFRGEAARTPGRRDANGAGLGLAITRAVVDGHGGRVEVRNLDDGCEFTVRLPVAGG